MNIVTRRRYLAPNSLLSAKTAVYRRPFSISTSRALFGKIGDSLETFNEHLRETSRKEGLQYIPFEKWPRPIQSFRIALSRTGLQTIVANRVQHYSHLQTGPHTSRPAAAAACAMQTKGQLCA